MARRINIALVLVVIVLGSGYWLYEQVQAQEQRDPTAWVKIIDPEKIVEE